MLTAVQRGNQSNKEKAKREPAVEKVLAEEQAGVRRCGGDALPFHGSGNGRTFPGTLMVAIEQFRGEARLRRHGGV